MGWRSRPPRSREWPTLDEELEEFRSREWAEYPIVYLDARRFEEAAAGRGHLKAIEVNRFGTREVLGLSSRSVKRRCIGDFWEIHKRGLRGVDVCQRSRRTEGGQAGSRVLEPLSGFHLSKNAQQLLAAKRQAPIAQAMRDIFDAPSREDAEDAQG